MGAAVSSPSDTWGWGCDMLEAHSASPLWLGRTLYGEAPGEVPLRMRGRHVYQTDADDSCSRMS